MAKKENNLADQSNDNDDGNEKHLTPDVQKKIEDLIYQKKMIARDQEAYKEALSAVAESLGLKSGVLSRRVGMIIKEEDEGGEVKSKENDILFTEQYFALKDNK